MMPSVLGSHCTQLPSHNHTFDPNLDELSRQLALSESLQRISRSSNGQRSSGPMRVMKPRSANNSPQTTMARRRTMMNDSNLARRRQQAIIQQMQDTSASPSCYMNYQEPVRSSRPVSWHPSTQIQEPHMHIPLPQSDFTQYMMPTPASYHQGDIYTGYQNFPPTPAVYSGQTSPLATYSPLSLPFAASHPQPVPSYVSTEAWNPTPHFTPNCYNPNSSPESTQPFPTYAGSSADEWDMCATQVYNSGAAPPTPDEFQAVQQPQPLVTPEESIPYQPLEEPEEEGEILVGMGLYDTPSKSETDPELDNYRTTTSRLLGTTYRTGKGWKLEEAWEPPATDDEDSDEDADAEEQAQDDKLTESPTAPQSWI
ncbi:hypothetical protein F5Y15DRAFT_374694 [Xylariaceae sp. FL0016]|nr:hypothetical protein F5Y15DRAFT_374694 [Xylariaceae sp. FL0016]